MTAPQSDPTIIDDEDYLLLTNGKNVKYFHIALGEANHAMCSQFSTITSQEVVIPFTCDATWVENYGSISISDVFHLDAAYVDGRPACVFTTHELSPERQKSVSGIDRTLALSVRLTDQNSHIEYNSHRSVHIRFIPDTFITKKRMTLEKNHLSDSVDVYGSKSQLSVLQVRRSSLFY